MASAAAPEVERLTDELVKRLGNGPLTPRQLAVKLVEKGTPTSLIGALDAALSQSAAADETDQLDESLWGSAPTAQQLTRAQQASYTAFQDEMRTALADALTREQAAARLGITPQAVSKRLASRAMVALRRGRVSMLPAWQFDEGGTLPGLKQLIDAYPGGPLSLTAWATSPSPDLADATPAHALARRGGVVRVLEAASALGPAAW
ncbi:MAG TPA: hypothetical protein VK790_08880 [Solirubrobacteraceae bacterium]|jgi:hypothetical protein|nr:hypothetical protein [Solirubrobacteraceae bacterium]